MVMITDIEIRVGEGGYPYLQATIDGLPARVPFEQKAERDYGLLFVGSDFEDRLPVQFLPPDGEGRPVKQPIYGFVDDPALLAAYRKMRKMDAAGELQPGLVNSP